MVGARLKGQAVQVASVLALVASLLVTSTVGAAGLGPSDRGFVDGVTIEEKTGAVRLLLVVDLPLEDGLTKQRVRNKILAYRGWLQSDKFRTNFPAAKPEAGRLLLIAHPKPRNALGRSVLDQSLAYASELGFKTEARELPAPSAAK
jgi:hypothetical protein